MELLESNEELKREIGPKVPNQTTNTDVNRSGKSVDKPARLLQFRR